MTRARSVLLILLLLAGSLSPPQSEAQGSQGMRQPAEESKGFYLEQNYPNPVSPETWIPFTLDATLFENDREVTATIRIYNGLNQLVAYPEAMDHPTGRGLRIFNLSYAEPGRKIAYWDGKDTAGRPVMSGVYYIQLVVDGEPEPEIRRLIVLNTRPRRRIIPW
jgi:hypothetical protein